MEDYELSWDEVAPYELYDFDFLDFGLSPGEVIERFYSDISDRGVAEEDWIDYVSPNLNDKDIEEILNDFGSAEECARAMSVAELAEDLADFEVYSDDELDDMFKSAFEDEIEDYLNEPTTDEVHDEWNRDYERMKLPR